MLSPPKSNAQRWCPKSSGLWVCILLTYSCSAGATSQNSPPGNRNASLSGDPRADRAVQSINISVLVSNEHGDPVPGATITILGSRPFSKSTDSKGRCYIQGFSLDGSRNYHILAAAEKYETDDQPISTLDIQDGTINKSFVLKTASALGAVSAGQDSNSNANSSRAVGDIGKGTANSNAGDTKVGNSHGHADSTPPPAEVGWWGLLLDNWLTFLAIVALLGGTVWLLSNIWGKGYRLAIYNIYKSLPPQRRQVHPSSPPMQPIQEPNALATVARELKEIKDAYQDLGLTMKQIVRTLALFTPPSTDQAGTAVGQRSRETGNDRSRHQTVASVDAEWASGSHSDRDSFLGEALENYKRLANHGSVSPEPVYLNADATNNPKDLIEARKVLLEEVDNDQGTFVLFRYDNVYGWVFPNPTLTFRRLAVRSLFPDLTEDRFNCKEALQPVRVSRLPDGRWQAEGNYQ